MAAANEAEARDAILRLWQARSSWPEGWPPPRAAAIAKLFDGLPDFDEQRWLPKTTLTHLQDVHHQILATLVALATKAGISDIEQQWIERFGSHLSPSEILLLEQASRHPLKATSTSQQIPKKGVGGLGTAAHQQLVNLLSIAADQYVSTLKGLTDSAAKPSPKTRRTRAK